ncbi:MAG: hypothetical protein ACF8CQ_01850 [Rhodopirellula sp. JB044]|uniref:hypothetical protein n=1 Tax=Rhodopirellula sp. JB044 TaxID=3342844 RepID=UPI00370BE99F
MPGPFSRTFLLEFDVPLSKRLNASMAFVILSVGLVAGLCPGCGSSNEPTVISKPETYEEKSKEIEAEMEKEMAEGWTG